MGVSLSQVEGVEFQVACDLLREENAWTWKRYVIVGEACNTLVCQGERLTEKRVVRFFTWVRTGTLTASSYHFGAHKKVFSR
jgi:hypothetical protein